MLPYNMTVQPRETRHHRRSLVIVSMLGTYHMEIGILDIRLRVFQDHAMLRSAARPIKHCVV